MLGLFTLIVTQLPLSVLLSAACCVVTDRATILCLFPSISSMATVTTQSDRDRQPERYTIASLATPQRTAAEAECKRVATQGMLIGSGIAVGVSYFAHKMMEASCQFKLRTHSSNTPPPVRTLVAHVSVCLLRLLFAAASSQPLPT